MKLGELLVRANVLQESQLKAALVEQQRWGGKLGDILVRMSLVTEDIITRALSKQLGVPAVNLGAVEVPGPDVLRRVPARLAEDLNVIPLQLKDEGRTLVVAMSDPMNVGYLDTLRAVSRCRIVPMLAGKTAIDRHIAQFYRGEISGSDAEQVPSAAAEEEAFKVVDAQGRTVVKNLAQLQEEARAQQQQKAQAAAAARPATGSSPAQQLKALEEMQRKEVAALKAMVEILVEKGVFTRDEYLAKVRK